MVSELRKPMCIRNMELEYENQIVNIKYNSTLDVIRLDVYIRACDKTLLGRDGYQRLASVEARLIRKYQITQRQIEITKLIDNQNKKIVFALTKVGHLFEYQLQNLQENGIYDDNDVHWSVEFFFFGIGRKRGEKLWCNFYELYVILKKPILTNSEIDNFEIKINVLE
ncbi:hypothetical protein C1646_675062 [Rhizophagus diaphanus]|nr:hypothetical protein C1646_675062 [Rhizophagus diaphanus] [Rhizophagus sp. MUCL 43196]